ncbi:MAG: ribonuclease Z, partial [Alkalibacterium sp.]
LKPRKIEKIFITHMHGDHIFGLPGLLSSRAFQGGDTPVTIYGPKGIKQYVTLSLKLSHSHLRYGIRFVEIEQEGKLFEDEQFVVTTKRLQHGVPSYGFRIVEKDRKGELMADKLQELGVPFGPLFGKLKKGETIVLDDGQEINGQDFIGPRQKGRIVTILGDTKYCEQSIELAKDADVLVHESTFLNKDKELAHSYNHSTNIEAVTVAKKAGAAKLLLTHISARYLYAESKLMEKEAQKLFSNTFVMSDFTEVSIPLKREEG